MNVHGEVRPPGDKSISHRALILAALARGTSEITGILPGADVQSTARVLRQMGAKISTVRPGARVLVAGRGLALRRPTATLHCGNSGTTARLGLGVLAGQRFMARLTGDASLRGRPMRRVTEPLERMGARVDDGGRGTLPLAIRGGALRPLDYASPVASAQLKSALLLAGLVGGVPVTIREPYRSRDHTERVFAHLGLDIHDRGGAIQFVPSASLVPALDHAVPADISSAAFLVAAAVMAVQGELTVLNVGVNPTRTGFLTVLARMGARVDRVNLHDEGGEPVADLIARPAQLRGTIVTPEEIPLLIDEVPILAVLASRAQGETVFREVGELRVKESNRLELVASNLRALGGRAEARGNDLFVQGSDGVPRGRVETAKDHRLAMAFAVLGTVPGAAVRLSERASVRISYPAFFKDLQRIGRAKDGKRARHRD